MEQKYDFVEVTLEPNHYELVKEIYRLHKEQANNRRCSLKNRIIPS